MWGHSEADLCESVGILREKSGGNLNKICSYLGLSKNSSKDIKLTIFSPFLTNGCKLHSFSMNSKQN